MASRGEQSTTHGVPTYEAPEGQCWYHFLHGDVPGHEIDFIYRPEVPQGPLTRQHFSHVSRLLRYIEPRSGSAYAFAIGNLSRDDTQHEPGRGAVALIFGLRIRGAKDHAGRQDPPFCHAIAAVDRHLDEASLLEAAVAFHRRLLPDEESQAEGSGWYHAYVRYAQNAEALPPLLRAYVADFDDLPAPGPSRLGLRWTAGEATPPKRVVIVHRDGEPFEVIAACAARIAGVLVESDIRWTAISTGREADLPNGVSVRFVAEQDAGPEDAGTRVLRREEVPEEPGEIAELLFGAQAARLSPMASPRTGWRQLDGEPALEDTRAAPEERASPDRETVITRRLSRVAVAKRPRARERALVALGALLAIGAPVAALMIAAREPSLRGGPGAPGSVTTTAAAPKAAATEVVSAAPQEPDAPVQMGASEMPRAASEGPRPRRERPATAATKRPADKGVYDIDLPPALKK